ncbi:hypothetical protein HOLleu_02932 [Holothuria leucospilota]|uniref:Uncharacterized protein n=1 Tax=Holothuria leucospilota TaxID=206669 RepID=A0A9Q1CS99_HOLLE|nr:hypothetical protein HOLleu_02932 [Holothuria leucospilota]
MVASRKISFGSIKRFALFRGSRKPAHRVQAVAKMLIPCGGVASEALNNRVLSRMQADAFSREVRRDPDILAFGNKLLSSHPKDHQPCLFLSA